MRNQYKLAPRRVQRGPFLVAGHGRAERRPPGLFLLGLSALVFGAWPRRTSAVVYGYLAWSLLVEFAGGMVHTRHWLMDTSVFFHMVPDPATTLTGRVRRSSPASECSVPASADFCFTIGI